jgi:hypothetical protein
MPKQGAPISAAKQLSLLDKSGPTVDPHLEPAETMNSCIGTLLY